MLVSKSSVSRENNWLQKTNCIQFFFDTMPRFIWYAQEKCVTNLSLPKLLSTELGPNNKRLIFCIKCSFLDASGQILAHTMLFEESALGDLLMFCISMLQVDFRATSVHPNHTLVSVIGQAFYISPFLLLARCRFAPVTTMFRSGPNQNTL